MTAVGAVAVFSMLSILSYNVRTDQRVARQDLNDAFDYLSNQVMLPLGGFPIALFVGWFVSDASAQKELAISSGVLFETRHFLKRYVVPPAGLVIPVFGAFG